MPGTEEEDKRPTIFISPCLMQQLLPDGRSNVGSWAINQAFKVQIPSYCFTDATEQATKGFYCAAAMYQLNVKAKFENPQKMVNYLNNPKLADTKKKVFFVAEEEARNMITSAENITNESIRIPCRHR